MNPTSRAAMIVPSRTPFNSFAKTKESSVAITVIVTSQAIFVLPNSRSHVCTTARTKDSPGSIATSARTSQ